MPKIAGWTKVHTDDTDTAAYPHVWRNDHNENRYLVVEDQTPMNLDDPHSTRGYLIRVYDGNPREDFDAEIVEDGLKGGFYTVTEDDPTVDDESSQPEMREIAFQDAQDWAESHEYAGKGSETCDRCGDSLEGKRTHVIEDNKLCESCAKEMYG